jgi:methionyl-tRNA formyltransferase
MPADILDIPHLWSINVHGSLLPEYRGASPLQTVFLDGKKETWITIMRMSEWMDEWDIITTYQCAIPFHRTAKDLFEKVMNVWPKVLGDALWDLWKWHITPFPQDNTKATYCSKIKKDDWKIDLWETPLAEVYKKYKAYALWPKTRTTGPENFPKIAEKTLVIEDLICDESLFHHHGWDPVILEWIKINPAIASIFIKPEGKKSMPWSDFVNGYLK